MERAQAEANSARGARGATVLPAAQASPPGIRPRAGGIPGTPRNGRVNRGDQPTQTWRRGMAAEDQGASGEHGTPYRGGGIGAVPEGPQDLGYGPAQAPGRAVAGREGAPPDCHRPQIDP